MTSGRVLGGPSRGADAPTRTTRTRDGIGAILAVLALGLVFRLIIAQLNPGSGFKVDLASFQAWAGNLATEGLRGFYDRPFFHDYTPGYLYVLYLVGLVGNALGGIGDLIKIPPILADLALGWLVWSMARELGAGRRAALIGAALVVANPVAWFDSVLWGQVDSFGVAFLLLGLRELWRNHPERAAVLTVVAALIKPQLAILAPIVAVVTIRRALWPTDVSDDITFASDDAAVDDRVGGDGAIAESAPTGSDEGILARIRAWERRTDRPVRIVTTGLAGFLAAVVLCFPFGLSVIEPGRNGEVFHSGLIEQVFKTAGGYPFASVNAYNPWALAEINGNGVAANSGWACDTVILGASAGNTSCPEAVMIGPIPAVYFGAALLAIAFIVVSLVVARRPTPLTILTGVTILAVAFFVLPTRVHERYLFPMIAVGAILAAVSVRWRIAYAVLSLTMFLNMYVVLTTLYPDNPGIADWLGIGSAIRGRSGVTLVALAVLGASLWVFAQLRPSGQRALADELAASTDEDAWIADDSVAGGGVGAGDIGAEPGAVESDGAASDGLDGPRPGPGSWAGRPPWTAPAAFALDAAAGTSGPPHGAFNAVETAALPVWIEPPSLAELGPVGWFRAKLAERPVRADRTHGLHDEPGGRLDRLDVWILVVLVVAILGIRMFRLSEPYQMHFDEVYHARTATEFLQDWRYGIEHDIYEWTHPHLAKYAMAGGLVAWGDDRVTATSDLGVPVVDAAIEPRSDDPSLPNGRAGDRVDVVTGSDLRSYDLQTRALVASIPIGGASAVAVDRTANRLFVGGSDGSIVTLDTASFDAVRLGTAAAAPDLQPFGQVDGSITRLFVPSDGSAVIVVTTDDKVRTLDPSSGDVLGTVQLETVSDIADGGSAPMLTGAPGTVANPTAAARALASILGGKAATYEARLQASGDRLFVAGVSGADKRTAVQAAIDDGRLAGLTIDTLAQVAVADANGVELINPATGELTATVSVGGPAHGLALTSVDDAKLYVATDPNPATVDAGRIAIVAVGGDSAKNGAALVGSMAMPGPVRRVAYDDATEMVHVLGRTPDGTAATIYVIDIVGSPPANAVYADAALPFEPTAWVMDAARPYPTDDREQILAFSASGAIASVDVGQHEFAWRLPGVLAGAAMAGFLYLLARILFRRRSVGVLVAIISFADGMFFVQSRIGMNDAYVGLGIVAAYTLFAALWTGVWRHRGAFWIAMPLIGGFLGLALASKWVGLYAIGGIGLLILVRSALGRFLTIAALIGLTAVLGYLAINVPAGTGFGNLPFVAIMVGLTVVAVVANVAHPVAWSLDEIRFAVGAPVAVGGLILLAAIAVGRAFSPLTLGPLKVTPIELGGALVALALVIWVAMSAAARIGFGPLAAPPDPDEPAALLPAPSPPPAADWLRPGAQLGLPVVWMIACVAILPIAIYVLSYLPWAFIENHRLFGNWPDNHTGQSLLDLTGAMYNYHNGLTAPHAASSPWWAWLFDFKPVWFYQEGLAGNTIAAIYDAGNLVGWWLGLPALAFVAWQAFARRSPSLALIAIGFACQWVSWARIDRASFQYHYYTSLPFLFLALAYFLAELWHGASRRTWLMARLAGGVAILGPAIFWIFDRPLCGFVGVDRANANSQACPPIIPQFLLTTQTFALASVVGISVLVVVVLLGRLRPDEPGEGGGSAAAGGDGVDGGGIVEPTATALVPLILAAAVAILATVAVRLVVPDVTLITLDRIPVEPVAVVLALPAVAIAALVATARDARRFVVGAVVAIVAWFVIVYPNISALPLPAAIANAYQGVLPTYLYAFQFPVNNVAATAKVELFGPVPLLLGASLVFLSVVVAYSAWIWRMALAERAADQRDGLDLGPSVGPGGLGSSG